MPGEANLWLLHCRTYDEYKEAFIIKDDTHFLRNHDTARSLVELGYRSSTAIYTPEEFEEQKKKALLHLNPIKRLVVSISEKLNITDPVLRELARRELTNTHKIGATIIFLKYTTSQNFTVSGYIDFEESLRKAHMREEGCIDWHAVFKGELKLRPRPTDLSWYSWRTGAVRYNNTGNWKVVHDFDEGVLFMHLGDNKLCSTQANNKYARNFNNSIRFSEVYGCVHFFDHILQKKS